MAAAYLFFNYNCILDYEISFSVTRKLCSIYRSTQPLRKIHTALHKLILIVLQLPNHAMPGLFS